MGVNMMKVFTMSSHEQQELDCFMLQGQNPAALKALLVFLGMSPFCECLAKTASNVMLVVLLV